MEVNKIIDRALDASGLGAPQSSNWLEGLELAARDCNQSDLLSPAARQAMERNFASLLTMRFKIDKYTEEFPDVLQQEIESPVFIVGLPRTGSTLTSKLLAADHRRRALLSWERQDGIPPATTDTLRTDPRCLAMKATEKPLFTTPDADKIRDQFRTIHHDEADDPAECNTLLAYDFWSTAIEVLCPMPEYREWLLCHPANNAYAVHKNMLQILQSKAPGRWSLKSPVHSLGIDALLDTYPDAKVIWTHRDPYVATSSFCSMVQGVHTGFGLTNTHADIADYYPGQLALHVERLIAAEDAGELNDSNRIHIHYDDMLRDPVGQMHGIYEWLDDVWTPEVEQATNSWVAENPQDKFGQHKYSADKFGLDNERLSPLFQDYIDRYMR